jgi:broad-specificity NMP kinase
MNPGFENLKELLKEFADNVKSMNLDGKAARTMAEGAKAGVERAKAEFSKQAIEDVASLLYKSITDDRLSESLSQAVRGVDVDQLRASLEASVNVLKDEEKARQVAAQIKKIVENVDPNKIEEFLREQMETLPLQQKMAMAVLVVVLPEKLAEIKAKSVEELAGMLTNLADQLPIDDLVAQIYAANQAVTPERVSVATTKVVAGLPAPKALAELFHGIADAAVKQLDRVITDDNTRPSAEEFAKDVQAAIDQAKGNGGKGGISKKKFG